MLDYEWNILTGAGAVAVDEPTAPSDHHRHLFDHYSQTFNDTTHYHNNNNNNNHHHHNNNNNNNANNNNLNPNNLLHHHHHHNHNHYLQPHPNFTPFYDPRAFSGDCTYAPSSPSGLLPLDPPEASAVPYMLLPKTEPSGCAIDFTNNRIGLNLGGRTYFSSAEDDFVNRLYRRSRPLEAAALVTSPRCQAEGCNADLTNAKHYHRRHKVCEFHSKASTVITAGLTQRFCQQCSRFHLLSEFDNGKRSCRKRLADHNRRRRKSSQNHDHSKSVVTVMSTQSSSSEIISRYQSDSRV